MKRLITVSALVTILVSAAAAQSRFGVTATTEKGVDYAKLKTYSWTQGQPSPIKEVDSRIVAAVDRELGAIGMTKATSGKGDVLVAYWSLRSTHVDLKAKPDAQGLRPEYPVGTLAVLLFEPNSRRRLLRLRLDKPIDTAPEKLDATINDAVTAMFEKYPTRTTR
jgi:hypothetical protein